MLQHASVQPFLDQPHDVPICNPVLDELANSHSYDFCIHYTSPV
jgi:hypothetical protein